MKRLLIWAMVLISILNVSCAKSEEGDEDKLGSIYGIITASGSLEPLRGVGVELCKRKPDNRWSFDLVTQTITYDDGHYELRDIQPGKYVLNFKSAMYHFVNVGYFSGYDVEVLSGKVVRADIQLSKNDTHLYMFTSEISNVSNHSVTLSGSFETNDDSGFPYEVGFFYSQSNSLLENGTKIVAVLETEKNTFSTTITDMPKGMYYVMSYGKNNYGIEYGELRTFVID